MSQIGTAGIAETEAIAEDFGYVGSRATGIEQGDYLVAGPDWHRAM